MESIFRSEDILMIELTIGSVISASVCSLISVLVVVLKLEARDLVGISIDNLLLDDSTCSDSGNRSNIYNESGESQYSTHFNSLLK